MNTDLKEASEAKEGKLKFLKSRSFVWKSFDFSPAFSKSFKEMLQR